ncbi:MAG: response regulator [Candidatus Omnitrophota bacterium]
MQDTQKSKILVVDDEPDIVYLLKAFLVKKGFDVTTASSGEEALKSLDRNGADLVLLDFNMPGISGRRLAQIAKEKYPKTKFVMLTGFPDTAWKVAEDNTLEDILIKPIEMKKLYSRLSAILTKEEDIGNSLKPTQKTRARVVTIKAKLLFVELNTESYELLKSHFISLSANSEDYQTAHAQTEERLFEKAIVFKPDIYLINSSFKINGNKSVISAILEKSNPKPELIIYQTDKEGDITKIELERVAKLVHQTCMKLKLIDLKWTDVRYEII